MESANRSRNRRNNRARKPPKVPIKTYRWEDIRRARRRGGYPWTYLYKLPFHEEVDPEQFTMDALRRSKSASTVGARSDGVDISDVSSYFSGKTTPNFLHREIITEPYEDTSAKHSRAGSEIIEEFMDEDDKDLEDDVQVKEFQTGSIASSDNISQYLDKEERGPGNSNAKNEDDIDKKDDTSTSRDKRAQSEETPTRKRRLSAESSHSKYSLSRLSVIKKLKDAKSKIKVPKMTFATKKILRRKGSPPKDFKKEEKVKKDVVKSTEPRKLKKNVQPVYIHIPLKPPPGETDEFSHLEFEPKPTTDKSTMESEEKSREVKSGEMNGKTEAVADSETNGVETRQDDKEDSKGAFPFSTLEQGPRVVKKPPLKINPAFKQFLKDVRQLKDKELMEVQKEQRKETDEEDSKEFAQENDETKSEAPSPSKITNLEEEHLDFEEQQTSDSESPKEDVFDKLFEASAGKEEDTDPQTPRKQPAEDASLSRNVRSKSAEPQRKRKSSIDSSYSRKSLSKLGIMKKLKEASDKIKSAFSLSSLKRSDSKKEESKEKYKEKAVKKKPATQLGKPKKVDPVYIHIPLKPPPGEKDEFSHLVKEPADKPEQNKEARSDSLESTSPDISKNGDIQFIFLTPPSDDEILDKDPDIPETPSSEDSSVFFGIGSLKKLAETVVDEVSPETRRKALETVREESTSDKSSATDIEAVENKGDTKESSPLEEDKLPEIVAMVPKDIEIKREKVEDTIPKKLEDDKTTITTEPAKMVVDVEDGLNEAPKTEELKSVLKIADNSSPVLKKKVSFKKKTRPSKIKIETDSGYETIEAPKEEKTINLLEQAGIFDTQPSVDMKTKENKDNSLDKNLGLRESVPSPKDAERKGFLADISQSMSVEDEKGYLEQKIVKDTSLEEDYNKWSRSGESSAGSSVTSLDVRCACQYFQSDSLLPNRPNMVGTRPVSFPGPTTGNFGTIENHVKGVANNISAPVTKTVHFRDHEYEPINPPEEVTLMTSSVIPGVTLIDSDNEPKVVISATEILDKPLEEKKKHFFQFGRFGKEKNQGNAERSMGGSSDDHSRSSQGREVSDMGEHQKVNEGPNKFQVAFKHRTDQLKNKTNQLRDKVRNIKKPNIHMPKTPEFKKPNFKKPDFKKFKFDTPRINLHLPKIPDTATIHLPHISLPGARKTTETKTVEMRQYSTESTAGDSESPKPRSKFDFNFSGTFPRFKKKKPTEEQSITYGTTPRAKKQKDTDQKRTESSSSSIRIPLHSEDSMDAEERLKFDTENEPTRTSYEDRETSEDIDRSSHMRFNKDIDIEDDYERENQEINRAEYLNRWQHGSLRRHEREVGDGEANDEELIVGQLVAERFNRVGHQYINGMEPEPSYERYDDNQSETLEDRLRRDEARPHYSEDEFDQRNKEMITDLDNLEEDESATQIRDGYSSEGSVSLQRQGRLGKLDVNSDEFFVVHEIRDGFQTPANALAQMNEYDPIGSNRSLPQVPTKRKPIKKPKRKKTPHVSQEEIPGDEESIDRPVSPTRPKRKSKKSKKKSDEDEFIPYQKTIHLEQEDLPRGQRLDFPRESLGILGDDEGDDQEFEMYENERMQGREQPEILVSDPYKEFQVMEQKMRAREEAPSEEPAAPPRRHRSLKSLSQSETGSIPTDKYESRKTEPINIEDYIIPAHETQAPPRRPSRRSRSQTSSLSRVSLPPSNRDTDSLLADEVFLTENQPIPSYLIENQNYKQQYKGNQEVPVYLQEEEEQPLKPCTEEPCFQDLRDYMGYSIVDKSRQRDPPLPPPKTTRRKKRHIEPEQKFATVPRDLGLSQPSTSHPIRPLRNYSTLGQVKGSKKNSSHYENDDKENREVDIARYIEIDEELNKDLISGDVVQKMRQRPLPAPPRPPRKTKTTRKSLQDITSKENIIPPSTPPSEFKQMQIEEETVSTQTDPLPPDFVCEEIHQEPTDTIIMPRIAEKPSHKAPSEETPSEQSAEKAEQTQAKIRRELITPSVYSFEETVTHGSLIVEPLNGAKVVPDHQLSRERLIPVTKEDSDEETSEIPESFMNLKNPEDKKGTHRTNVEVSNPSIEVLRTDKLQVSDLDVDRLRVNELLASKIVVSEIDSASISTNEIQGKSGPLRVGDIELPSRFIEEIVRKLEEIRPGDQRLQEEPDREEKKTPISEAPSRESTQHRANVESPLEPSLPLPLDADDHLESISGLEYSEHQQPSVLQHGLSPEPPIPPPRNYTSEDAPPDAPPRTLRRKSKDSLRHSDNQKTDQSEPNLSPEKTDQPLRTPNHRRTEMLEPEIDDQPPPRPPEPLDGLYMPSQPPASFYALRAKQYVGLENENIPTVPRRKRRQSKPVSRSRSTSDDSSLSPSHHRSPRSARRLSDSSIPELSGRLIRACGTRINSSLKRLIYHLTENILRNADGKQDLHVFMIILLVLIAGLILLGYGEERTVVHLHHWEYFNPPKDL